MPLKGGGTRGGVWSGARPRRFWRNFEHVQGWGLKIVDSQSSRWGGHEGTTHVWFELERRGPRLGADNNPAGEPNEQ